MRNSSHTSKTRK